MKKYFDINRNTGVITSKVTFDREIKDEYVVQLKAIDGGYKFGFATLRVFIEDVNDNSPQFFLKEYKLVISSSIKPTDTILEVSISKTNIKIKSFSRQNISNRTVKNVFHRILKLQILKRYFCFSDKSYG